MIRRIFCFSLLSFLFVILSSCQEHQIIPQSLEHPFGKISRNDIIKKHLDNRKLDLLEGLWVWDNNLYEVCIVKKVSLNNRHYDYVAVITETRNPSWSSGETKITIKKTASKRLFSATYYMGNKSTVGTSIVLVNDNILELALPIGPYGSYAITRLFRTYPLDDQGSNSPNLMSTGTGFFISKDIIVTNYHVIAEKKDIKITIRGIQIPASVLVKDQINDLTLLRIQPDAKGYGLKDITPVNVGDVRDIKEGDTVFSIGYPLVNDLGKRAKISEGIINSISGVQDDPRMFQMSVPTQPGNSGSPLFNNKGQVIGVVTSTINNAYFILHKGAFPQNVNYSIKINYVNNLIAMLPDKISVHNESSGQPMTASQIMTSFKDSVVLIEARK